LGFIEESRDVDNIIANIGSFFIYAAVIGQLPFLHNLLAGNPILPYLYPEIEQFNPAVKFALKCIEQTESSKVDPQVRGDKDGFLSRFQKLIDAGVKGGAYGGEFGRVDALNHSSTNMLAGSDTTAIALRSIIHQLITNPLAYRRLQEEIDSFDKRGLLSDIVKETEARQMPYLQAVIKEGLRIHPSVGMLLERHVPKGTFTHLNVGRES